MSFVFDQTSEGKVTCPKCGKPKRFRTIKGYDDIYGICDRSNSCGYKNWPSEKPFQLSLDSDSNEFQEQVFIAEQRVKSILTHNQTAFHTFCKQELGIPLSHLELWKVGGDKNGNTAFVLFNGGSAWNVKHVAYESNGKRDKKRFPFYEKTSEKRFIHKRCLFGAHLLDSNKITCLVESEKTAVISAHFYSEFNWVASGGNNSLTSELIKPLKGHHVIVLFDADDAGRKNRAIDILQRNRIASRAVDLFPNRNDGFDMADAIVSRQNPQLSFSAQDFAAELSIDDLFKNSPSARLQIVKGRFISYLIQEGFGRIKSVSGYTLVRVQENIVEKWDAERLQHFFLEKVRDDENKYNCVVDSAERLFSRSQVNCIPILELDFLSDTPSATYFPFLNGCLKAGAIGLDILPFDSLEKHVRAEEIIQHEIDLTFNIKELRDFMFARFLKFISGEDENRIKSLQSILGYVMNDSDHIRKAVVLTDATLSENPEGRSGKSLLYKCVGKLRSVAEIDAKTLRANSQFRFQSADEHTQIVALDDISAKGRFSLEPFFSAITQGLEVEQKHQAPFTINCKLIFTSNRALETNGGSARDRVVEFELSDYFSDKHHPEDEFGTRFFDSWSTDDWNKFYLIMISCSQVFHKHGIIMADPIYLATRKIIDSTSKNIDFLEFCSEIEKDKFHALSALTTDFKRLNSDFQDLTNRSFAKWMRTYAENMDFELLSEKRNKGFTHVCLKSKGR